MNKYSKHLYKKIKEYETIVIVRHQNSDLDALGSQFALKEWINLNFPNKKVYCLGANHQKYSEVFTPKCDTFNGEGRFLGICCDVNSIERIDGAEIFKKAEYKICIDHHFYQEKNEFDFVYVNNHVIACCQIIAELLFDMKKKLNKNICMYLYAGIYNDSGSFFYPLTDYNTLRVGAKLLEMGNINAYDDIYMKVEMDSYKDVELRNQLFNKTVYDKSGFAYYINSIADLNKLGINASSANEKINDFNRIQDIKIFLAASESENGKYRCSIRSKNISVVEVAQKYGGGGHKFACGVKELTKEEVEKMRIDLTNLLK